LTCRIPSTEALRQIVELFGLTRRRSISSEGAMWSVEFLLSAIARNSRRSFPPTRVPQELLQHIQLSTRRFSRCKACLCGGFSEAQRKEQIVTAYLVILWSERSSDGCVGHRLAPRHASFTPSDVNLLIAVGSQTAMRFERSLLYEQTRQAYDDLRKTQEQLLHSEKMARCRPVDFRRGA